MFSSHQYSAPPPPLSVLFCPLPAKKAEDLPPVRIWERRAGRSRPDHPSRIMSPAVRGKSCDHDLSVPLRDPWDGRRPFGKGQDCRRAVQAWRADFWPREKPRQHRTFLPCFGGNRRAEANFLAFVPPLPPEGRIGLSPGMTPCSAKTLRPEGLTAIITLFRPGRPASGRTESRGKTELPSPAVPEPPASPSGRCARPNAGHRGQS